MLTRVSRSSSSKTFESGYVFEKAKETLRDASSVPNSVTQASRHAGSGTKRRLGDGLSLTVPRGESGTAIPLRYPRKGRWGVIPDTDSGRVLGSQNLALGTQKPRARGLPVSNEPTWLPLRTEFLPAVNDGVSTPLEIR